MRNRLVIILLLILVVLGAGYVYASPYLTVWTVRAAAMRGDAETVNAHVDFPALRQSFKDWIGAVMINAMAEPELRQRPFVAFGMVMTVILADKMIEAMFTPAGMSMMLQDRRPEPGDQVIATTTQGPKAPSDIKTEMGYEAWDRFVVKVVWKENPGDSFTTVWLRSGLTWKLSAVRLPGPR